MEPSDIRVRLLTELSTLQDFYSVVDPVMRYISGNLIDSIPAKTRGYSNYTLLTVDVQGSPVNLRPINNDLFIWDVETLRESCESLDEFLNRVAQARGITPSVSEEFPSLVQPNVVSRILYTLVQAVGCGLDLFVEAQFARKNFGTRFEDFICALMHHLEIPFKRSLVVTVPIVGEKLSYRATTDLIVSPFDEVRSSERGLAFNELIVSAKTSSKDRMKLIFLDRYLLTQAASVPVKVVALFHNDVQRAGREGIASTFVADLFLIFCRFFGNLDGVYFVDLPYKAREEPWSRLIKSFEAFLTEDLWMLIGRRA